MNMIPDYLHTYSRSIVKGGKEEWKRAALTYERLVSPSITILSVIRTCVAHITYPIDGEYGYDDTTNSCHKPIRMILPSSLTAVCIGYKIQFYSCTVHTCRVHIRYDNHIPQGTNSQTTIFLPFFYFKNV